MKPASTAHIFAQLAGAIALVASVHAAAWSEQITDACTDEGRNVSAEDIAICHAYTAGFLDGAIITDTAIVASGSAVDSQESNFFKRAYLTRVGSSSRSLPATALAQFCLPEGTERTQVVATIANALPKVPQPGSDVAESLYQVLKAAYPCE